MSLFSFERYQQILCSLFCIKLQCEEDVNEELFSTLYYVFVRTIHLSLKVENNKNGYGTNA